MKNEDFIKSRQEILIQESMAFSQLEDDKYLRTMDSKLLYKQSGLQFVHWKQELLNLIKNSNELALRARLLYLKSQLCKKCRKGLRDSECYHQSEYKTFIACQWIQGSLI